MANQPLLRNWHDGHCAVKGHSRSPILGPIKSPYATSLNNTNS